jgi:hypothetical protein
MSPSNEGESGSDRPAVNPQRQESVQTYDTSSQIPEMPPEVLGDEEDEQLVTYELVQGCYNRHPAREETYPTSRRGETPCVMKLSQGTSGSDASRYLLATPFGKPNTKQFSK